jgi:erythromycin esterase-like protein
MPMTPVSIGTLDQTARALSDADWSGPFAELIDSADLVLLGEASHGSHEFYRVRADITRELIRDHGFTAVAVEGDWPDCYRINRYVRGFGQDPDAASALGDFRRFPLWMWRNKVVEQFISWLRDHNRGLPYAAQAGFYGLDMYSLHGSMHAVIDYLEQVDPQEAAAARRRYACFDHAGGNAEEYGFGLHLGRREDCADDVLAQLLDLQRAAERYVRERGLLAEEDYFAAARNAEVVRSAESYYRQMFSTRVDTWNLRDSHMMDTLAALREHLSRENRRPRIVVWAHNSHVGDARATDMAVRGEHNLGQLTRQRYGNRCRLIGFTTFEGSVSAASRWDGPVEHKRILPAVADSHERLFHDTVGGDFFLPLRGRRRLHGLDTPRLQRAIGVIYRPETERISHYFHSDLMRQFDGVIHIDRSRALEPLDAVSEWQRGQPDTYPYGL